MLSLPCAPLTHLPDHMDTRNSPQRSSLALLLLPSNTLTLLQTVCYIHNNRYTWKQFAVSRMDSTRLESQNTSWPLILSLSLPPHPLTIFSHFSNWSHRVLRIYWLLVVELFSLSHSTPSHELPNNTACIDCIRYSLSHQLHWFAALSILGLPVSFAILVSSAVPIISVFSCLSGYSQSLVQGYWDPVINDYIGTKVPAMSCCLTDLTASFHCTSYWHMAFCMIQQPIPKLT